MPTDLRDPLACQLASLPACQLASWAEAPARASAPGTREVQYHLDRLGGRLHAELPSSILTVRTYA